MPYPLTKALGKFASSLRYESIPPAAVQTIQTAFVDCVGVMIAGRNQPAPLLLRSALRSAAREAHLTFSSIATSSSDAAWINGTAAHALDFDDVDSVLRGHPSAVLVPAILAASEALNATGRQMIQAYFVGHQVWAELSRRDTDLHHNKGWHPTGVFGAIGAAAACANLSNLPEEQATCSIALGASQSAGLVSNIGTMTKPFHAGFAARAGVISAQLATKGFSAAPNALEHERGFLQAISPAGNVDTESGIEAGTGWNSRLTIKKYPLCFCSHRAVDGILDLIRNERPIISNVRRVVVSTSLRNAIFLHHHLPQTALEAKFSMEFAMACALVAGRVGLAEATDEFVTRNDVQDLMRRITIVPDKREDPFMLGYAPHDSVSIEMTSGVSLESGPIASVRGDPEIPLTRDELWRKFSDCVNAGEMNDQPKLFEALNSLEGISRASDLYSAIE